MNGILYVRRTSYIITGYSGLIIIIYCYYLSDKLSKIQNINWYKFHAIFHFFIMYEACIVLDSIEKTKFITI